MDYIPDTLEMAITVGISAENAKRCVIQLSKGINVIHTHKCVHLDLKPANILVLKK